VFAIRKNLSVEDIDRYVSLTAEVRGTDIEKLTGFRTSMIRTLHDPQFDVDEWAARQVYIALGFFMASAAIMGIDTCPIEGFVPEKYDDILGLNDQGFGSCVVAAAGYRAGTDRYAQVPKVRFRNEDVIHRI
jgi:nitroreductase